MGFKKGGLLESVFNQANDKIGICQTCINLTKISDTAIGCVEHDKFIISKFPPYHENCKCKDWKAKEG